MLYTPSAKTGGIARARTARAMLFRAFVAQNCAVGCSYGGFGVSMLALQNRFDASRGAVSLGLSLVVLTGGLAGPLLAALQRRFGLRNVMIAGAAMCSVGYALAGLAPTLTGVLLAYGLFIGPGVGLSGTLPATLLVGGWYPHGRGKAIGLATMPVVIALIPICAAALIEMRGLTAFYLALAALHFATMPVLAGIHEAPVPVQAEEPHLDELATTLRGLLAHPLFWAAMLGGGLLNAIGIIGAVHMVGVVTERGLPLMQAALLASLMGGASVVGAVAIGWLCDHVGGAWALAAVAVGFAASWATIALTAQLPLMLPAILLIGIVGPGVYPGISVLLARAFGAAMMARAMALFGMFSIPMTFLLPPLAGWVHDSSGSYAAVMATIVLVGGAVAAMFATVALRRPMSGGARSAR